MIKEQLDTDLNECLENVVALTPGQKERKEEADLAKLFYELKLEEDKLELERQNQKDQAELEKLKLEAEAAKAKEQHFFNWLGIGVQLGTTIFMATCYNMWLNRGFRFEEFGTIRSPHMRNLIGKILPRLK